MAHRSVFVQECTKRVGAASIQYWRWRGHASKAVPGAEEPSSKGLNPETAHPAASSARANLGGRFGTCCGQFCPQGPGKPLSCCSETLWALTVGVLSRGRAHSSAEVTEMNGWPRLAPGPAAGLWKLVSHWDMAGLKAPTSPKKDSVTSRVPAHKLN